MLLFLSSSCPSTVHQLFCPSDRRPKTNETKRYRSLRNLARRVSERTGRISPGAVVLVEVNASLLMIHFFTVCLSFVSLSLFLFVCLFLFVPICLHVSSSVLLFVRPNSLSHHFFRFAVGPWKMLFSRYTECSIFHYIVLLKLRYFIYFCLVISVLSKVGLPTVALLKLLKGKIQSKRLK